MKYGEPHYVWLSVWAFLQICCVILAITIITRIFQALTIKDALYTGLALVGIHWLVTYALLRASSVATESPGTVAACTTVGIIAVAAFPTEPRLAQTLAATVFVAVVLWQTFLKLTEE